MDTNEIVKDKLVAVDIRISRRLESGQIREEHHKPKAYVCFMLENVPCPDKCEKEHLGLRLDQSGTLEDLVTIMGQAQPAFLTMLGQAMHKHQQKPHG